MVGDALQETVNRVEGMTGKGSRDLPSVVTFVNVLVHESMMEPAVDPVD